MKFDFYGLNESDYLSFRDYIKGKTDKCPMFFVCYARSGDICFDIAITVCNDKYGLEYDLYVGGIDTGYGYSREYPYDHVGGDVFSGWENMEFEDFKKYAISVFEKYIYDMNEIYKQADLIKKANEPLKVW